MSASSQAIPTGKTGSASFLRQDAGHIGGEIDVLLESIGFELSAYGDSASEARVSESRAERAGANLHHQARIQHGEAPRLAEMNREEVQARLEASEARVATAVESMRADNAALRADIQVGIKTIESQGQVMRSEAASFFSDARRVLAEIQVAQEKDRNQYYAMGYKVIVWSVGTVIAVTGLGLSLWNAFHKATGPTQPAPIVQPASSAVPPQPQAHDAPAQPKTNNK